MEYFCHSCGRPVTARVVEATQEVECDVCHSTFVEVVDTSTRSSLDVFLRPPQPPPSQLPTQSATSTTAATTTTAGPTSPPPAPRGRADAAAQADPQTGGATGDRIARLLERSVQALVRGDDDALSRAYVLDPAGGASIFGLPAIPLTQAVAGAGPMNGRGGGGGVAVAPQAPLNAGPTANAPQGRAEAGLPPRVELYVNRGDTRGLGTAGSLLSILQPLLSGVVGGTGTATTLGDYAVGDITSIIDQIMWNDPNRHGAPPASARAVEALEVVKHTEETASHECPVCKDAYSVGEEAKRMPCEHVFHPDCLTTWLKAHNSCPVCRYELSTDDPEYERFRQARSQRQQQEQVQGGGGDA